MEEDSGKAKYYVLMEELKMDIVSGRRKPGDRLPSEHELSASCHVSRHTVRKALSILEQEGFIEAEHGRGTFVSRKAGRKQGSGNIAVITTYLSDYIFPRLIQGIDSVLTANGYSIILKNTGNSRLRESKCLEEILEKDIDGLIIEPSKSDIMCGHKGLYDKLDFYQIPYVFIQGCNTHMKDKPHILMDDSMGGYLVTKHLLELGHEHILGIFKADDSQGRNRHRGYVKAIQEAGFSYDPDMVVWFHTEDRMTKPSGALRLMLEEGVPVDGIVCYNDQIAFEVMKTIEKGGFSVPEDISVTGYDNSFIAENGLVKLTTIAHPQERLGAMAAELLLEKINHVPDEESKVERILKPVLIIRNSCRDRRL
ncbi:GntR family transcriptional regulator [Lacrimispora saccharolytica]|uniref:Transcriptional regulator, GntR family with LacI sensor n=1 Tax=Lacrimispora saccharolytica (strain ATCC 35040 / DSM 2544 / NRCC 2533 / WM1) TaxID=610130 RepID=D9R5A3_LACSW|nr:GntR family transcriptional regulator [Lacrimispora saccharolytica]ADL03309.1 transcriptional regulator, GntR family with LacI sensor [[Clostridium] saccharolyticum WM1]QRV18527.1 GntR family transcriptional regulator [Lacrimispora saccharolytica]